MFNLQAGFYGSLAQVLEHGEGVPPTLLAPGGLLASHVSREMSRVVPSGVSLSPCLGNLVESLQPCLFLHALETWSRAEGMLDLEA